MVDRPRFPIRSKYALKPAISSALSTNPPEGFLVPPALIDRETIGKTDLKLREQQYVRSYTKLTSRDWNDYVQLGIQQFASPNLYQIHVAKESTEEKSLRLARYFRFHLENKAEVLPLLLKTIASIEKALATTHPGFFDMSTREMDTYMQALKNVSRTTPPTSQLTQDETAKLLHGVTFDTTPPATPNTASNLTQKPPIATVNSITTDKTTDITNNASNPISMEVDDLQTRTSETDNTPITPIIRIETRWAPKDFKELHTSSDKFFERLYPILQCFQIDHISSLTEWQTDQVVSLDSPANARATMTKCLSICMITNSKQQCFYFSFRVKSTGSDLTQTLKTKQLQMIKKGEALTFDPSFIPIIHGELVNVGDILFKDASITHRAHYLTFLKSSVLPPDMPPIDIKAKHKDPLGNKIMLLTVRCGKSVATKVTEYLTQTLNGEGDRTEVFLSKLGLGAAKMNRSDLERIYLHHHNYIKDIHHIPFPLTRNIDAPRLEYNDDGQTITRSPRNWATTLEHDGRNLGVDIENGTKDGTTILVVPHENLVIVQEKLRQYLQRQNPALVNAGKFYENLDIDPSIPSTIFTVNISSLLNRELKPPRQSKTDTSQSESTTDTSLHTAPSKASNAWSVPLFSKAKAPLNPASKSVGGKKPTKLQRSATQDAALLGRIALLEEQLLTMSAHIDAKSITSDTTAGRTTIEQQSKISAITGSGKSNNSHLTIESAHQRLETIETKMDSIQTMLMTLMENYKPSAPNKSDNDSLSDDSDKLHCTQMLLYETPQKTPTTKNKRRKATETPDSSLQYNETMDLSGDSKC
jgi:hypothetical protein